LLLSCSMPTNRLSSMRRSGRNARSRWQSCRIQLLEGKIAMLALVGVHTAYASNTSFSIDPMLSPPCGTRYVHSAMGDDQWCHDWLTLTPRSHRVQCPRTHTVFSGKYNGIIDISVYNPDRPPPSVDVYIHHSYSTSYICINCIYTTLMHSRSRR
jgi:hypothetical protein